MSSPHTDAQRPHAVDLLIVGGGPAGLAAALRGHELGLSTLILEADAVMRRIRDYSKDKLILPGFGGGDRMTFPAGGDWIRRLPFDAIDKDDLVARWRGLAEKAGVERRTGHELTALDDGPDDTFLARVYDHGERRDLVIPARHVALAVGRGVPRRFEIPGETAGIALRLDDPRRYLGAPVCVIGGGTSAAEAVISLSNAKADARDPTVVHWSYRGDKLPRVSKALAETFFSAYTGHGNIRYHPHSEPLLVCAGHDRKPQLAIRVDRRSIEGRAVETTLLEFPVERCIACIGEDVPERFLASLGAPMATGGPKHRKRMVVSRFLESRRPRLYLLGDILSQAYFRTDDFDADPAGFEEVRHRGNITSATRDGVLVAQVVRQRLDGVADQDLDVRVADGAT
ncbi:MAG: FAD-dependent oxidoreductase, partial [Acidobacteriota bacterium]